MAKLTLDELVTQLKSAFGGDLTAVVLYGSAAGGEHNPKRSDQNVLVVVKQVPIAAAKAIAATSRAWADAGNPPPLVFTDAEWKSSSDVFPMEYADILDRHRVLHGASPFDGISVRSEDLRLQLENEAMGKLLHLRQAMLATAADDKKLVELMGATASAIMVIFRAVCRLHGEKPAPDNARLVEQVARLAQLDPEPFQRAVKVARGEAAVPKAEALTTTIGYVGGLERLVGHLDAYRG
ncbi:MAG TPA: nucleotidyltransferase domain-containing protein [Gemmatimonadaceae bacterium]|nr:nucleotidyltransferase domain-containing protein [Gemmatimonadaceae bacterium]